MAYPVHFDAVEPAQHSRLQLGLRLLAVLALGVIGVSTGGIFCVLYVGLPVFAAVRISSLGSCNAYVTQDRPRILFALRWAAAVTAWLALVVDRLPSGSPDETIRLNVEGQPDQTPSSAAWRVLLGLPSALVLGLLSLFGALVWLWAALAFLLSQSVPRSAWAYLTGLQRYTYRLLAYQAALVDDYPPFALSELHELTSAPSAQ